MDFSHSDTSDQVATMHRPLVLGLLLAAAILALTARLWFLQISEGNGYLRAAQANHTRLQRQAGPRGLIVDSLGRVLAGSRPQYAIYLQPSVAHDPVTLRRMAELLNVKAVDLVADINTEKRNDYDPIRVALDAPLSVITRIEEERPYLNGVTSVQEPVRSYPNASEMGNVLGTLGRIDPKTYSRVSSNSYYPDDFVGKTGLELEYEKYLHSKPGGTQVAVDARGSVVRQLQNIDPVPGDTLVLSARSDVQRAAEQTLHVHRFIGGAVAVDPRSGAVLAMATSPSFNPNLFATGIRKGPWRELNTNPNKPLINRALETLYPPGSTFKQVVAAAGLQCGAIGTGSNTYCPGYYKLGKATFHCWETHGPVDFYSAIALSCDVFFYETGLRMGPDRLSAYAREYPLAQRTGLDLPHEMIGSIPSPDWKRKRFAHLGDAWSRWYGGDTLNFSIGQGYVLVTPLQMAMVTATTANGGDVLRPYLVQRIVDPTNGATIFTRRRVCVRHVGISDQNLAAVRKGMRQAVTDGTGKIVDLPDIAVAAKTGSAQMHGSGTTHGWFVAFAPYDHPTIAVAAIVEHGGHGASSAGLVARAMLQAYFKKAITQPKAAAKSD